MRRLLISLLLASAAAATPALAQRSDSDSQSARGERQTRSESRAERREAREQARAERSARSAEPRGQSSDGPAQVRSSGGSPPDFTPRVVRDSSESARNGRGAERREVQDRVTLDQGERSGGEGRRTNWQRRMIENGSSDVESRGRRGLRVIESGTSDQGTQTTDDRRAFWRDRVREVPSSDADGSRIGRSGRLVQPERPLPRVLRTRTPVVSGTPREGTQPPLRTETRRTSHHRWSGDWRRDRRYDWWDWRRRHRSIFHLGFYFDPFGWNYRRYNIGWRLWPSYYSSRYWLHDPWYYRLPYAPPGYRWIRYHDDAILVDTWDGRVVDVIYNFFW
jgi:hypothetical protein